ncbi:gliding motility-associated C-terminal domain-containing protein [Tenacibaculum sp. MEBiC06402]|uniref:T9SS type B sorting domain-containing protein n=1 Tax=Tenacibaculum sp. MEBiC06402 TaxID=3412023 RepID=UPI003B9CE50E
MFKYLKINLKPILKLTILLLSFSIYGQTIDKPVLDFTSACATDSFNNFTFSFTYRDGIFDAANTFKVFLSDENGDFSPGVEILSVNNQNFSPLIPINGSFSVPNGTYGSGYRIRVVAENPAVTSPDSDPFGAYDITSEQLILNNFTDVALCNGNPETITLNEIDPNLSYKWYRNNSQIVGETGLSLTVTQPGEYYAEVDYGSCTDAVISNKVNVIVVNSSSLTILGDNTVDLCADQSYDLQASIDDPSFTYKWFKDGVQITGLPDYLPIYTTPTTDQFGVYHLEIEIGGCSSRSQDVTLQQKSDTSFDVNISGNPTDIIFPGETIVLNVTHDAPGTVDIKWFNESGEIPGVSGDTLNVSGPGEYYAVVTESSGDCPVSINSDTRIVLGVVEMFVTIRAGTDYEECNSASTELAMVGISVTATDGNDYDLSQEKIDKLLAPDSGGSIIMRLQWFKDTVAIAGAEAQTFNVNSYTDNGEYYLNVTVGSLTADSNVINLLLGVGDVEIVSSSNALCPGESIFLTIDDFPGYTYTWFQDGAAMTVVDPLNVEVSEIGTYSVTLDGFGCQINVTEIEIVEFDDSVLEVSPSTNAVLPTGGTITLTASGADSYEWYDEAGNLLSTNETLDVGVLGTYTVIGTVGGCNAQRDVNVIEDDGMLIIPNIITPFNGDGVNDRWELPNRFAFQPNVQVIIFNSRGEQVLNTTDYQNNWPEDNNLKDGMLFYFKVIKDNSLVKAGTISVLQ